MTATPTLGLVLSGGGARGIAHVGVIDALRSHGLALDCIAGSSSGAIVGALAAASHSTETMLEFFQKASPFRLSVVTVRKAGILDTAKVVSKLSRKPVGGTIAVVLRPCEIRAFIELVKLKQGRLEELVILGIDCLGAFRNADYLRLVGGDGSLTSLDFCRSALAGKTATDEGIDIAPACRACEYPVAEGADVVIGLLGVDVDDHLLLQSQSEKGSDLLSRLDLPAAPTEKNREQVIANLVARHSAYRDEMFSATGQAVQDLERLTTYLAGCVNCYNCRVACPVCYCKECVFVTDVFNHDPSQYLRWASRKGIIKMPTDTLFYHITRLAHMSTACVGCGQCSNACPNDIPVMELFRTVALGTQQAFEYEAGRSLEQEPPMSTFREDEFPEVVGISS